MDRKFFDGIQGRSAGPAIDDGFWLNLDRRNYQRYRAALQKAPHVLVVRPTHYDLNTMAHAGIGVHYGWVDGKMANLCVSFSELVSYAYTKEAVFDSHLMVRTEFPQELVGQITNQFDVIDTMRVQPVERLQAEIKRQLKERFAVSWHRQMRDTEVLLVKVKDPRTSRIQNHPGHCQQPVHCRDGRDLGNYFGKPVLDETGSAGGYDKRMELIPAAYCTEPHQGLGRQQCLPCTIRFGTGSSHPAHGVACPEAAEEQPAIRPGCRNRAGTGQNSQGAIGPPLSSGFPTARKYRAAGAGELDEVDQRGADSHTRR